MSELSNRMGAMENTIAELVKAVREVQSDVSEIKNDVSETDIVAAWKAVRLWGNFVKWVAGIFASIAAIYVFMKGGVQ